ncbi:hypothetical protein PMJ46TS7_73920 [Paenibacillus melissococcoides]
MEIPSYSLDSKRLNFFFSLYRKMTGKDDEKAPFPEKSLYIQGGPGIMGSVKEAMPTAYP